MFQREFPLIYRASYQLCLTVNLVAVGSRSRWLGLLSFPCLTLVVCWKIVTLTALQKPSPHLFLALERFHLIHFRDWMQIKRLVQTNIWKDSVREESFITSCKCKLHSLNLRQTCQRCLKLSCNLSGFLSDARFLPADLKRRMFGLCSMFLLVSTLQLEIF